ncbi:glutamate--tRNA ligase [Thermoplasmatales archaeon AK]|nr:glutamate--tRNA ligase [Thermoplasmatales archaeon AK]
MLNRNQQNEAEKAALRNAFQHGGRADIGAVMGKLLGQFPELRRNVQELRDEVSRIVDRVNSLSPNELRNAVESLVPEVLVRTEKNTQHRLPDLDKVNGPVVMRLAPSPSGPLHVGHSRMAILNDEYVKRYGGRLILRIEDTNPANIDPIAYDQIPKDLEWLGVNVTEIVIQSDRFELYYEEARNLMKLGGMYACTCRQEVFKGYIAKGEACPHREMSPDENLDVFQGMLDGKYQPGKAVLVVKTDLSHPNPAIRDWIAFRISSARHPRLGNKYRVYPTMNWGVAIDDHHLGLTHVIRGKDHISNTEKQRYVFRYNGWKEPVYYHYGLVNFPNVILKTSIIKKGIASGTYSGWDDIRLGTILAMKKRGYSQDTFRRYWIESGLREINSEFSIEIFNSINKEIIDPATPRMFFVPDPVKVQIKGLPSVTVELQNHPSNKTLGKRTYSLPDNPEVHLSASDWKSIPDGSTFRLKELGNVVRNGNHLSFKEKELVDRKVKIIQWCPPESMRFQVLKPDGTSDTGLIEDHARNFHGVAQLERYAYVNIGEDGKGYFLHK